MGSSSNSHQHSQLLMELDNLAFTPVEVPEGDHRLQSQYCLWYSRRKGRGSLEQGLCTGLVVRELVEVLNIVWYRYRTVIKSPN